MLSGISLLFTIIVIELIFLYKKKGKQLPWNEIITNINSGHIMVWLFRGLILFAYNFISVNYSLSYFEQIPAVCSPGWKIHNESFFKSFQEKNSLDFISFLKFRGGYGQIGNSEPAGDFAYKGTTSINSSAVIFGPCCSLNYYIVVSRS